MAGSLKSDYESIGLQAVRPYLIVSNADAAIDFYRCASSRPPNSNATRPPAGGVAHAKLQIGETILEIGEHPDAGDREVERLPRVGLRLYVTDVDDAYARALAAGRRPGMLPQTACQVRVRRVSRIHSASPGGYWQQSRLAIPPAFQGVGCVRSRRISSSFSMLSNSTWFPSLRTAVVHRTLWLWGGVAIRIGCTRSPLEIARVSHPRFGASWPGPGEC